MQKPSAGTSRPMPTQLLSICWIVKSPPPHPAALPLLPCTMWYGLESLWSLWMSSPRQIPTQPPDQPCCCGWELTGSSHPGDWEGLLSKSWSTGGFSSVNAVLVTKLGHSTRWAVLNQLHLSLTQYRHLHIQMLTPAFELPNHHISMPFLAPLLHFHYLDLVWNL